MSILHFHKSNSKNPEKRKTIDIGANRQDFQIADSLSNIQHSIWYFSNSREDIKNIIDRLTQGFLGMLFLLKRKVDGVICPP